MFKVLGVRAPVHEFQGDTIQPQTSGRCKEVRSQIPSKPSSSSSPGSASQASRCKFLLQPHCPHSSGSLLSQHGYLLVFSFLDRCLICSSLPSAHVYCILAWPSSYEFVLGSDGNHAQSLHLTLPMTRSICLGGSGSPSA